MKKVLSVILALAMVLALGVTAFAADDENTANTALENGTWSKSDITIGATIGTAAEDKYVDVYYVNISWETTANDLKYTAGQTVYNWSTEDLSWKQDTKDGAWTGSATVNVTVENRSSQKVWAAVSGSTDYGMTFTGEETKEVATANVDNYESGTTAPSETFNVEVEAGDKATSIDEAGTVATLTITLSKTAPATENN